MATPTQHLMVHARQAVTRTAPRPLSLLLLASSLRSTSRSAIYPSYRQQQQERRRSQQREHLSRPFTTTCPRGTMFKSEDVSVSSAVQEEHMDTFITEASELVDQGRWTICDEGRGVEKDFRFKNFKQSWAFMSAVAEQCEKINHHPEWSNVYNRTSIRWTTHQPRGLSRKDTYMAKVCDDFAKQFGEVTSTGSSKSSV